MKPAQTALLDKEAPPHGVQSHRPTLIMIWVAIFLIAALASVLVDSVRYGGLPETVARALGPAATLGPAAPPPAASPQPTAAARMATRAIVTPPPCVPPDDWGIHEVVEGDTISSLAEQYGTDVDTLMIVNCLSADTIFIGQKLYAPGAPLPFDLPIAAGEQAAAGAAATGLPRAWSTAPATVPIPLEPAFKYNIPNTYLNIVLLGSDKRPDSGAWRTDSMIVVSIDERNRVVRLLSLPRDLWVDIPGHGYNRINTADLWGELARKSGGPDRVKQTIYQNLGIPIHYYVRVDFQGFMKIVDTLGGVDIDVEYDLPDMDITAGMHHMDGITALRYARSRYTTSDFDRGRRQRKVLMALWEQALTLDVVPRLPALWVTMADTFETDLPLDEVINLAYLGTRIKRQHILSGAIDASLVQDWVTPAGAQVLLPRQDRIRTMLESFYAPLEASQLDAAEQVRVQVLNGSRTTDAEQLAAAALRWKGYQIVQTGAASRRDYAQTSIVVTNGDLAAGQAVARILCVSDSAVTQQATPGAAADVQVLLGADYSPCKR
jgi:LCP family protein required for cell wall assembly